MIPEKNLTQEEKSIMKDIDANYVDVDQDEYQQLLAKAKKLAKNFSKKKTISLRVNEYDLERIKGISLQKKIPYQTLINMAIHNFVKESL